VDIFAFALMLVLDITAILMRDEASPIVLSMLITSVLTIQDNLIWMLRLAMYVQSKMVSVVRCMKLIDVPQER